MEIDLTYLMPWYNDRSFLYDCRKNSFVLWTDFTNSIGGDTNWMENLFYCTIYNTQP